MSFNYKPYILKTQTIIRYVLLIKCDIIKKIYYEEIIEMNLKQKKYIKHMIFLIITMFALIFITVLLTGEREISDFTNRDVTIFIIFILLEIAICIKLFHIAIKCGKEGQAKDMQKALVATRTKYENQLQLRKLFLVVSSYLLALGFMIFGIIYTPNIKPNFKTSAEIILLICSVFPILSMPLNIFLRNIFVKKIENTSIQYLQHYVYSYRDLTKATVNKKHKQLVILRLFSDVYAIIIALCAFSVAFFSGLVISSNMRTGLCMFAAILFLAALSRIRFSIPHSIFDDDKSYVDRVNYPYIYSLAEKAANKLGCKGEIRIAFTDNFNAGIARIGNIYSVQLGVLLLNVVSQDELYCILLHEFSHMTSENEVYNREMDYNTWLQQYKPSHFLSGLTNSLFIFIDSVYAIHFGLYLYASSLAFETTADNAMANYGNPKDAASALLKIKYYDLYSWEKRTYDEKCLYEPETLEKRFLTYELNSFLSRLKLRKDIWKKLASVEILARSASHPTLKMRFETLGISEYELTNGSIFESYKKECNKALHYMEDLIYDELIKDYEDIRKKYYLEPLKLINSWEATGKPIVATDYADIIYALQNLGRNTEILDLCNRAISELKSDSEVCHAKYMRGCFLLHQFNELGLADIYYAIEHNNNYFKEGIDVIGEFCCLTGNQEELDIYRKKAIELAQQYKDVYSYVGTLTTKDKLTTEQLPDGMLEDILCYISGIDENSIATIYLVRKIITEDFFTSVFVIEFKPNISIDIQDKVLHKIFSYLDTCSSWQFSLFNFNDINGIKLEKIPNSCVYRQ